MHMPSHPGGPPVDNPANARALYWAMLSVTPLPWLVCIWFFGLIAHTYAPDRARAEADNASAWGESEMPSRSPCQRQVEKEEVVEVEVEEDQQPDTRLWGASASQEPRQRDRSSDLWVEPTPTPRPLLL